MARLAERLMVWGPCVFGAVVGALVDYFNGFWGPGLASGAVLGFLIGQRRRKAKPAGD